MKKTLLPALLGVALLAAPAAFAQKSAPAPKMAAPAQGAATAYKLQPQLSTLGWEGKAVTHGHNGTMQFTGGDLLVRGNMLVGGMATVDMKTLKATDITDADNHAKFVGHMSSADFFDAGQYPTSTFKIVSVAPIAGAPADSKTPNATITGDMTIKGVTQRVSFPAAVGVKNGVASASGKVVIDRTKYGLKYGSKSFFDSLGDKAINDEFTLDFNVIAKN